jgi:hypothetical protein
MLPAVRKLETIEMIRDGGSFAAKFESDGESRYILFIEINQANPSSKKLEKDGLGYLTPILIDCDPQKRPADSAEKIYSELSGPAIPISWNQAREILSTITSLATELRPMQTKWLERMVFVAANEGMD